MAVDAHEVRLKTYRIAGVLGRQEISIASVVRGHPVAIRIEKQLG